MVTGLEVKLDNQITQTGMKSRPLAEVKDISSQFVFVDHADQRTDYKEASQSHKLPDQPWLCSDPSRRPGIQLHIDKYLLDFFSISDQCADADEKYFTFAGANYLSFEDFCNFATFWSVRFL